VCVCVFFFCFLTVLGLYEQDVVSRDSNLSRSIMKLRDRIERLHFLNVNRSRGKQYWFFHSSFKNVRKVTL